MVPRPLRERAEWGSAGNTTVEIDSVNSKRWGPWAVHTRDCMKAQPPGYEDIAECRGRDRVYPKAMGSLAKTTALPF